MGEKMKETKKKKCRREDGITGNDEKEGGGGRGKGGTDRNGREGKKWK